MPARRSTSRSRGVRAAALAVIVVATIACGRGLSPDPGADAVAPAAPGAVLVAPCVPALSAFARETVAIAAASARALRAKLDARDDGGAAYLALRRDLARAAPFLRARATMASEVLFGPPRSGSEAGGARLALDGALARGDAAEASRRTLQIERGLAFAGAELERAGVPVEAGANALSDAAYELGAMVLEATPDLPAEAAAMLADDRGTLDAIVDGGSALARELAGTDAALEALIRAAAPLRAGLVNTSAVSAIEGRGALALATGRLGAAVRLLAAKGGARVRLPYPARVAVAAQGPGEPISILTLPAPRRRVESAAERRALAEVGRLLFEDKRLSRGDVRACSSCHQPARGFADGLIAQPSLDPAVPALRHTPTLLYTSLHAAQMWDGGTLSPESQALHVIHRRAEMGLDAGDLSAKLSTIPAYREALRDDTGQVSPARVAQALVAYEVEALVPADAPIDRFARGDEGALPSDQRRGLDVFVGKGRCARCHVPPFFGGSRPLDFAVPVFAVIGVPVSPAGRVLDPDRGRALSTHRAADERAFKTPTVRNVARTAPYFHHGRFARLEDVVAFYTKGGGRGFGLEVPNQDPDVRPLQLTAEEERALLVFLREALLDASSFEPAGTRR